NQGIAPTLSTWYLEEVKTVKALKFLAPEIKRDEEVSLPTLLQRRVAGNGKAPMADANEIDLSANTNYQQTVKSFDLSQHYTINDGSEGFQVELKTAEIPATYEYYVAPKYDKDAYLTAKVVDWEKYDLMEGSMKLYFEDTYLGDSYLDVSNKDTLTISLGKDKGVLVTRTKSSDFRKKQSLGSNKTDSRAYDIVVRNMKRQAINLIVEDQFPISKSKEIEILDQEAPEAEVNKETGKLSWKFSLEPNKEKKVHHQFSVKSPKAMVLSLD
ncbi:MAG: DUF4139 domain-containing protein, partial [Spirosomataceae bacterium]